MESSAPNWIGPLSDGKITGYIDWNGSWVLRTHFSQLGDFREGLAAFQSNSKVGYLDRSGNIVIDARFDSDTVLLPHFREGLAPVSLNGRTVYVEPSGAIAFAVEEDTLAWNFIDGKAILGGQDRYSVINREWQEVSCITVFEIPYFFDFPNDWNCFPCLIYKDQAHRRAFIDWRGEFVFPPLYAEVGPFFQGVGPFSPDEQFGPYGLVSDSGEVLLEPTFYSIGAFSPEGLAPAAKEKKKFGFINTAGEWVIPPIYQQALSFSEGLACVTVPSKHRHGIKGFINSAGEMIIEPRFHRQASFQDGWALAECDGMEQIIDRTGKVIWETPITVNNVR